MTYPLGRYSVAVWLFVLWLRDARIFDPLCIITIMRYTSSISMMPHRGRSVGRRVAL